MQAMPPAGDKPQVLEAETSFKLDKKDAEIPALTELVKSTPQKHFGEINQSIKLLILKHKLIKGLL